MGVPWSTWRWAKVSRVDAAVDLYGVYLTDWVWDLPGRGSREVISRQREVRTVYLGAKRMNPMVVYNKGKQDPSLALGGPLTRVEYRAKYNGPVAGLLKLPNPFAKVVVFDPRKLSCPDPQRTALMSLGHLHGRQGILQSFPANSRPKFDLALAAAGAPWWQPEEIWSAWVGCLKKTARCLFDTAGPLASTAIAYQQAMEAEAEAEADVARQSG